MKEIIFVNHDGNETTVELIPGESLMQLAVDNNIETITGDCGGACACATCHCYLPDDWIKKLDSADEMETSLIECCVDPKPNSRLGCQVEVDESMDGMKVFLPRP